MMSRWLLDLPRFGRWPRDHVHGGESINATLIDFRSLVYCVANFTIVSALSFLCQGSEISRAEELVSDKAAYARAVEYCRGNVTRPMALDLNKQVLCLDGAISAGEDVSLAKGLEEKGLFVVRSSGGDVATNIALADLLQGRRATVVVYDYCLLACASYLLFASEQTFVLKDSIVAWRYALDPLWCPSLATARDEGSKRLEIAPCSGTPPGYQEGYKRFQDISRDFYAARGADPLTEWPPQSAFVRKILQRKFEGTGTLPDYYWTWHPRHVVNAIKTKIVYEAYPQTQNEIDAIAAQISLYIPIIYDP